MRKTDMVTYVGYTVGGKSGKGKLGTKVRFSTSKDNTMRVKELYKMGASEVWFAQLPQPMSRLDAIQYLKNNGNKNMSDADVQAAIAHAENRISNN